MLFRSLDRLEKYKERFRAIAALSCKLNGYASEATNGLQKAVEIAQDVLDELEKA